jgi:hypothetical protein
MNIESQLPRSTLNNNAMKMIKRLLALLIICGLTCPVAANAGVESLLYLAGGELRSVGFDGTSFTSGFTSLTTPIPEMTGISYDPLDDILYYLAGGELRSVGFDGSSFTSGFTSLTTPIPEMVGISVIRTEEDVSTVAEPSTVLLFGGSLIGLFFANARRSRRAAIAA